MRRSGNRQSIPREWQQVKKLLAVRLDSIGDVLMTSPALAALRESLGCRITLMTSPAGAAVAARLPVIDEVIIYEAPWMKATQLQNSRDRDWKMIEELRTEGFDAAVIFTVYSQNPLPAALMSYLADVPLRLAHCRENPYHLLTHWIKEPEPEHLIRHEVRRQLDLVAAIGCETSDESLRYSVRPDDRQQARALLTGAGMGDGIRPVVLVHPGASAPSRRYPPEMFRDVVRLLVAEGLSVVATGSAEEIVLTEQILGEAADSVVSLAGKLTLGQVGALLEDSSLLIANNTGPVHLAAAVGTPVVDLYALTNPQHTPWMVPNITLAYDVPCRLCYQSVCPQGHHDCLRQIEPSWVVAAARTLLMNENPEKFFQSSPDVHLYRDFPAYQTASNTVSAD